MKINGKNVFGFLGSGIKFLRAKSSLFNHLVEKWENMSIAGKFRKYGNQGDAGNQIVSFRPLAEYATESAVKTEKPKLSKEKKAELEAIQKEFKQKLMAAAEDPKKLNFIELRGYLDKDPENLDFIIPKGKGKEAGVIFIGLMNALGKNGLSLVESAAVAKLLVAAAGSKHSLDPIRLVRFDKAVKKFSVLVGTFSSEEINSSQGREIQLAVALARTKIF